MKRSILGSERRATMELLIIIVILILLFGGGFGFYRRGR
jgi:hypothetical protein